MDWDALWLTLRLGTLTVLVLIPLAIVVGRWLAVTRVRGKAMIEAALALPLVLPPTVVGFYLLVAFGSGSWFGRSYEWLFSHTLVFTFQGLLIASVLVNIPFAVQPVQRAFEAIAPDLRDAAATCGMSGWRAFRRIELPLAWPGILTGMVLTFAHTLGEFGVVLMVAAASPAKPEPFRFRSTTACKPLTTHPAAKMAALLLIISLVTIALSYLFTQRIGRRYA
jgi:molybdate transport system permease protein